MTVDFDVVIVREEQHHELEDVAHSIHVEPTDDDVTTAIHGGTKTVANCFRVAAFDFRVGIKAEEVHLVDQCEAWFSEKRIEILDQSVFHSARDDVNVFLGFDAHAGVETVRVALIAARLDANEGEMFTSNMDELRDGVGSIALASAHRTKADVRFSNIAQLVIEK